MHARRVLSVHRIGPLDGGSCKEREDHTFVKYQMGEESWGIGRQKEMSTGVDKLGCRRKLSPWDCWRARDLQQTGMLVMVRKKGPTQSA